uniref:Uncharacterized protein n=1 Tax=Oryza meridionalis TaxID=40149 RepID=A0A0E0EYR6_9ORYZ
MPPVRLLADKSRDSKLVKLPNAAGMLPNNLLSHMNRIVRFLAFLTSRGILPVSMLLHTSKYSSSGQLSKLGCMPKASEMSPVKWFPSSRTRYRLVQFFRHGGSMPLKLLWFAVKRCSAKLSQMWRGRSPEKLLLVELTCCKAMPLPRSAGMVPLMWRGTEGS